MSTVPIKSKVGVLFVVYASQPLGDAVAEPVILSWGEEWCESHCEDPLKTLVLTSLRRGLVSIRVTASAALPPPPVELLRYSGLDELKERALAAATQVVVIAARDLNIPPRVGLWAALVVALAVSERSNGVLFDPDALRIIGHPGADDRFDPRGSIAASRHIIVPFSVDHSSGLGWMTTKGLERFGLPELELTGVPPNLDKLDVLVNSVAQYLIEAAMQVAIDSRCAAVEMDLPAVVEIDKNLVARALGRDVTAESLPESPVDVCLRFTPKAERPELSMIRINSASDTQDSGVWLNRVASVLLGSTSDIRWAKTSGDAMQEAHRRAVAELPRVRRKFAAGLSPGETLWIKCGFDTSDASKEYIWLVVNQWTGSQITGQVANQPRLVPNLEKGQLVVIEEPQVFDWSIERRGGPSDGGYTTRVLLDESQE